MALEYMRKYRLTHSVSKEKRAEYQARSRAKKRAERIAANYKPPMVTYERLIELLTYEPETGIFRWRSDRHCRGRVCANAGDEAGSIKSNARNVYKTITIDDRRYYAHRLAWLYITGSLPPRESDIDHIDADSLNNSFSNLRLADRASNIGNSRLSNANTSGFKGVSWHKKPGKWRAVIRHNGRQVHLGHFATPEEAHAAYVLKSHEVFGEFARAA